MMSKSVKLFWKHILDIFILYDLVSNKIEIVVQVNS